MTLRFNELCRTMSKQMAIIVLPKTLKTYLSSLETTGSVCLCFSCVDQTTSSNTRETCNVKIRRGLFTQACSPGRLSAYGGLCSQQSFPCGTCMVNFCQTTASPFLYDLNDILSLHLRVPVPTVTGPLKSSGTFSISSAGA